MEHECHPLWWREAVEDHQQGTRDGVAEDGLLLGPGSSSAICAGVAAERDTSPRDRRDRNMSRHTRDTAVVSQPPGFSMLEVSVLLKRSQAS